MGASPPTSRTDTSPLSHSLSPWLLKSMPPGRPRQAGGSTRSRSLGTGGRSKDHSMQRKADGDGHKSCRTISRGLWPRPNVGIVYRDWRDVRFYRSRKRLLANQDVAARPGSASPYRPADARWSQIGRTSNADPVLFAVGLVIGVVLLIFGDAKTF